MIEYGSEQQSRSPDKHFPEKKNTKSVVLFRVASFGLLSCILDIVYFFYFCNFVILFTLTVKIITQVFIFMVRQFFGYSENR